MIGGEMQRSAHYWRGVRDGVAGAVLAQVAA
jgi:hypothetical protein